MQGCARWLGIRLACSCNARKSQRRKLITRWEEQSSGAADSVHRRTPPGSLHQLDARLKRVAWDEPGESPAAEREVVRVASSNWRREDSESTKQENETKRRQLVALPPSTVRPLARMASTRPVGNSICSQVQRDGVQPIACLDQLYGMNHRLDIT